ncbi:MAG TPA: hypothetical protein VMN78_11420, partial [Longimicrobiales bacterium]|nr:hypothetical protein [Longimicrobiales bacterium]
VPHRSQLVSGTGDTPSDCFSIIAIAAGSDRTRRRTGIAGDATKRAGAAFGRAKSVAESASD